MKTYTVKPKGEIKTDDNGRLVDAKGNPRNPDTLHAESIKDVASANGKGADAIFDANREVIGSDPKNLTVGMVLTIPD